jgi:hypothetical protein
MLRTPAEVPNLFYDLSRLFSQYNFRKLVEASQNTKRRQLSPQFPILNLSAFPNVPRALIFSVDVSGSNFIPLGFMVCF